MSGERVIVCGTYVELHAARVLFPDARVVDGRDAVYMAGLRPSAWLLMPGARYPRLTGAAWQEVQFRTRTSGGRVYDVQSDLRLVEVAP